MNKKSTLAIIVLINIIALITVTFCLYKIIINNRILFPGDVGLTQIFNENIVSVKFDSANPNYIYDCEEPSDILPLLDTISSAVFRRTNEPKNISWLELVYIETEKNTYTVGVINGTFVITNNGTSEYYECSAKDTFLRKLFDIQKR